jgi:hypothetical protein
MAERRLDVAVPEVRAETQPRRKVEHDLQVRAGLAARRDERLPQLDERLRLLAVLEADLQGLGLERRRHGQHDVGELGRRGHEQVGLDEEVQAAQCLAAAGAVAVRHHHVAAEAHQCLDPPVEDGGVEVLSSDELEPRRTERPLVNAYRRRARLGQELPPVDRVRWHLLEQHIPTRDVQAAGQGVEDVDRAHGLRRAAVLLQSAPGVERNRSGLPDRPRRGDDVRSRHSGDLRCHVRPIVGTARGEQVPDAAAVDLIGRVGPVADEVDVVPAVLHHHVREGQGERRVSAGPDPQPVVGPGGEAHLAWVDDDQLRAARDRGGGARRMSEAGDGRVVPPEQDAAGVLEIR